MFTHKIFLASALIIGFGGITYSQTKIPTKVASLSSSDARQKTCELHNTKLKAGMSPINYGIASGFPSGYYQASQHAFPHAKSRIPAGCVILPDSPRFQAVKYCPQCRNVEKKWLDAHNRATSKH